MGSRDDAEWSRTPVANKSTPMCPAIPGGSVPDDGDDQDDSVGNDELEAKAAALRLRMKMI